MGEAGSREGLRAALAEADVMAGLDEYAGSDEADQCGGLDAYRLLAKAVRAALASEQLRPVRPPKHEWWHTANCSCTPIENVEPWRYPAAPETPRLTRYTLEEGDYPTDGAQMLPKNDGEWVRWDDVAGAAPETREPSPTDPDEARRLLGYLWHATGKNHLRPVSDLFAEDDPIVADIERLAIFPEDGA